TNGCRPNCRIRCQGSRIQIGDREFISASEALQAYMDQYTGLKPKGDKYDMNVTDLLDPKSVLHLTAERSLKTGVRATPTELKLAQSKDSINNSYDRMNKSSALRAEAEDALNRSGKLLNRLAKDEKEPAVAAASDVGSMSTDVLLTMNPVGGYSKEYTAALAAATEAEEPKRHGHVYSYRTARTRSRSLSRERPSTGSEVQPETKKDLNTNRPPSSYRPPVSGSGRQKERSRSVSPSSFRQHDRLFGNLKSAPENRLDSNTSKHKAPSWIEALDISNPSDNLWSKRDLIAGRPPPSWVQGLDGSDINSLVSGVSNNQTDINNLLAPNMDMSGLGNSTLSNPPGLSFKDLMVTPTKGKTVNFDLSSNNYTTGTLPGEKFEIASKLPREVLESGNTKLDSSDALDRYLEGLGCGPKPSTSSGVTGIQSDSQYDAPRCSSLDTTALLNGLSAPTKSDITGASPISRNGKSPAGSPSRPRRSRSRPQTPDTDLVLDGDRPWEKPLASFKAPVYMSEEESGVQPGDSSAKCETLTGRPQPGSLETLKNMLFKLQAEASEETSNREKIAQIIAESRKELNASSSSLQLEEEIPALKGYNYQDEPGGQSLEKAMVHLGRLKNLVEVGKEARSRSASRDRSMSRSRSVSPLRPLSQPVLS
ncbi:uncharacterized protein LOC132543307, partial [Ylistrum balloti]|uniref:uncharacterized protein LOC132543307 n=1 Tax=Ylistrum balloti TaxID=509963 RepID=UPI002905A425